MYAFRDLAHLQGRRYKSKRHAARKCEQAGSISISSRQFDGNTIDGINEFLKNWKKQKVALGKDADLETEFHAISCIMENFQDHETLHLSVAMSGCEIVGFSIDELLPNRSVLSHYFKSLPSIIGLSEYLNKSIASHFLERGYDHWNWEQDLGDPALQGMKMGYRPKTLLKKFILRRR